MLATEREELKNLLVKEALENGACAAGVASVEPIRRTSARMSEWIELGYHADMEYMKRTLRLRIDTRAYWHKVRSVLCVAVPYVLDEPAPPADGPWGLISAYARGEDYHRRVRRLLEHLAAFCRNKTGDQTSFRVCVDSAPVAERSLAASAGLGRIGRNGSLMVPGWGGHVVLGELLTELKLPADDPLAGNLCDTCTQCLEACPTGALKHTGLLDSRTCLSYLTTEHTRDIDLHFRRLWGKRLFGCDTCHLVCPMNQTDPYPTGDRVATETPGWPGAWTDLGELIALGSRALERKLNLTALDRLSRKRLHRNIALVLGNTEPSKASVELIGLLTQDSSELVKTHARWAKNEAQLHAK